MKFQIVAALVIAGVLARAEAAHATFHLWLPDEIYSDASGTVQFIEFSSEFDGQDALTSTSITSTTTGHTYSFPTDLPSSFTAGHNFLVATPGYAALAGAPAPDYTLPINNFFSTSGDSVYLIGTAQPPLTFTAGQLPADGVNSLMFDGANLTTGTNSPTDFAGDTGAVTLVPEPSTLAAFGLAALLLLRRPHA